MHAPAKTCTVHTHTHAHIETHGHIQTNVHPNTNTHERTRACILLCGRLIHHARNVPRQCPRGPMDKASAYGAGVCRFESSRGHFTLAGI